MIRVWPGRTPEGESLLVFAHDRVTPIPAVGGALVPYSAYYETLIRHGWALTYDPLGATGVTHVELRAGDNNGSLGWLWNRVNTGNY